MAQNKTIKEKKKLLLQKGISAPWQEIYGQPIDQLSDRQLSELFEPWNASYTAKKKLEHISKLTKLHTTKVPGDVLDIGCGTGSLCRFLSMEGVKNVIACDISTSSIECGRAIADAENLSIKFIEGNFIKDREKFRENNFSIIILDSVLEHIVEYKIWISKIHSLLKKDGKCIIIVPSVLGAYSLVHDFDWKHLRWKAQPYNYHPGIHCNHFWFSQLKHEFEKAGFQYEGVFKFQAFNAIAILPFKVLKLWKLFEIYTILDYYLVKILPNDIATRIVVFRKS